MVISQLKADTSHFNKRRIEIDNVKSCKLIFIYQVCYRNLIAISQIATLLFRKNRDRKDEVYQSDGQTHQYLISLKENRL